MPGGSQQGSRSGAAGDRRGAMGGFGGVPGGGGMGGASSELIAYLKKHRGGAKWLLAVSNSQGAAQLELSSDVPVISMRGFTGTDNAMTLAKLKELVKKGELHYIQLGGGMGGPGGGNNSVTPEVTAWVKKQGTVVKESAYGKSTTSSSASSSTSSSASSSASSSSSNSSSNSASQSSQSALYRLDPSDVG